MNRIVLITVIVLLVLSLAGNAVLGVMLFTQSRSTGDLAQELEKARGQAAALETDLSSTQQQLEETKASLAEKTERLTEMTTKYAAANRDYRDLMCPATLSPEDLEGIGSNQEMADFLMDIFEEYYGEAPVDISFDLLWSGTKTALFTAEWSDHTSSKTLVSWEMGLGGVQRIYDPGEACFFYAP